MSTPVYPRPLRASLAASLISAIVLSGCGGGDSSSSGEEGKVSPRYEKIKELKEKADAKKRK